MTCRIALPISAQGLRRAQDHEQQPKDQRNEKPPRTQEKRRDYRGRNQRIAKKDRRLPFGENRPARMLLRAYATKRLKVRQRLGWMFQ